MCLKIHLKYIQKYKIKRYYVYLHKIDSGVPFYVGKGQGNRAFYTDKNRGQQHQTIKRKYGCNVEIIYYTYDQDDAYIKEIEMIAFYHTWMRDPDRVEHCCNKNIGGKGGSEGRECTQETRNKLSKAHKGKKKSPEAIRKTADANRGKKRTYEQNLKNQETKRKAVNQYTIDKKIINTYVSIADAHHTTGVQGTHISACCNRKCKYAGGFLWRFVDDPIQIDDFEIEKFREIFQFDKNFNFIQKHISLLNIEKITLYQHVIDVCNHIRKTAGGFIWRFVDDNSLIIHKFIYQFDKNFNFIKKYSSFSEASERTKINLANIYSCCKENCKTAGGFIWRLVQEEFDVNTLLM
jgi:hypothetical protein